MVDRRYRPDCPFTQLAGPENEMANPSANQYDLATPRNMKRRLSIFSHGALLAVMLGGALQAAAEARSDLDRRFRERVQPFVETYCTGCHGADKPKGDLDLSLYSSLESVVGNFPQWNVVLDQLEARDMPPEKAKRHPSDALRVEVIDWIQSLRRFEASRNAGDPGLVLARRLNNAEFDYTIRDLTGVDLRPAREFPVDPANEAGFDNSGESLTMSPALVNKYLEAAHWIADHLVLKPEGFTFAPHPAVTDTDRDKYSVKRIIQFYQRQPTNYAEYFFAAWRLKNSPAGTSVEAMAREQSVSPKYLATVWSTLTGRHEEIGPIATLQTMWRELPASATDARQGCERMGDFVARLRKTLRPEVKNMKVRGVHDGSQSLVLWKDRQYATNRMNYPGGALDLDPEAFTTLSIPADAAGRARFEDSFHRFCALFPDAFFVGERARPYLDPEKEKKLEAGRLLSAGFHSQVGYFRDDEPLYKLVLDDAARRELDTLWQELDFVTFAPGRQHRDFLWFERTDSRFMRDPEFDFARPEDKDSISSEMIQRLSEVYLAKVRRATTDQVAIAVISNHFQNVSLNIRRVERERLAAEPSHLEALAAFAERAYRRPLAPPEREELLAFYRDSRKEGLSHEEAIRDSIASVLMAPHFMYRLDLAAPGPGTRPLSDYELASRLSYFLWSSMPDQELLEHAAAGKLRQTEVLLAQARRMLQDDRATALAREFAGHWLDFRRFEEHNSVDRERFPIFDNELRRAMFEEPLRFFGDLARRDGSILDFLYANHTFVNAPLARHYGITGLNLASNQWLRVDDASQFQRGGLLPMSVFLTRNAPGLRTSPVKRGYWVARRLLGEHIPAPPPNVGELPADESKLGGLTLRETLERHRADPSCSSCHEKFDSFGLAFEGYGAVGELRAKDYGGLPVDTRATFPRGGEGAGLEGLVSYLREHREPEFVENFCRKFLAYALGRGLILSDDSLLAEMRAKLASNGYRFTGLVESIVTSPQFLAKRGQDGLTMK
jgi:hypothetical protein